MMKKRFIAGLAALWLCCLFTKVAYAADAAPVTMLRQTADTLLVELKQNRAKARANDAVLYSIVERVLLPKVDTGSMARAVIGRTYWTQASATQRQDFVKQFTRLVTRTYSSALSAFADQTIRFLPIRGGVGTQTRLQVNSLVTQENGPPVPINYRVVKVGNTWRVYDLIVDGISMVRSYRSQFEGILAQDGMTGLLKQLRTHNQQS